jgi:protein TonB
MAHAAQSDEWRGESLRSPLIGSVLAHVAVFGAIGLAGWLHLGKSTRIGENTALGGGTVSVTVGNLVLPHNQTRPNPVADDSKSELPKPPKPEKIERVREEPDATPIRGREPKKPSPRDTVASNVKPKPIEPERIYSRQGQQVSSNMYGRTTTGNGVDFTNANPFGDRFGAYAALIQTRVMQQWALQLQNLNSTNTTPAYISVEILSDGNVRNLQLSRSSGDYSIDQAARRAVQLATPFDPLPRGFPQSSALVEFKVFIQR